MKDVNLKDEYQTLEELELVNPYDPGHSMSKCFDQLDHEIYEDYDSWY